MAVNLAEGRVVICAAKDGIVVAAVDAHTEPDSPPPVVVALGGSRAAVMMGAVEWVQPESKDAPARLDAEFPRLAAAALHSPVQQKDADSASDIEALGVAVLERLRLLAGQLHNKISMGEDEPLLRIVLVDYVEGYGPEAWTLDYHIRQEELASGYWQTRVLRPSYTQLYPPDKGKPRTLLEVRYPPADRAKDEHELLDLLHQNDARLSAIRAANQIVAKSVASVVDGQSQKSMAAADVEFLKLALRAVVPQQAQVTMANVDYEKGFQWILEPPRSTEPPPAETKPQEPGAPSLLHKAGT
ncbi:MAG: hypothetical protein LAO08_19315 [Acidobacteriia bacterium]|nr:hypothetical protein [Terriglobia bacterium]